MLICKLLFFKCPIKLVLIVEIKKTQVNLITGPLTKNYTLSCDNGHDNC